MYCRNCGNEMDPNAAICLKCGVAAGQGQSFCSNCGDQTQPQANICMHCGAQIYNIIPGQQKSKLAAGLLGIFLGAFGVHNFYLGYTGKAIAQLLISVLSCGIFAVASSIWGLIEGILILTGSIDKDAQGMPLKE